MEDENCIVRMGEHVLLGVFDGHGGGEVSQHCRENLHVHVFSSPEFSAGDLGGALRQGELVPQTHSSVNH